MRRLLAPLIALFVLALALRAETPAAEPKPIAVPFELLKSRHMVVSVKVNGKGPYRLIFDTGAPLCLLNNKVAKESGLTQGAKAPPFALFGTMGQFTIPKLELGELEAKDVPAVVMDHPTVAAISKAFGPIDGIVGYPFFARYRMTVDYQAKELTFVPNGYRPTDLVQTLAALMMGSGKSATASILVPGAQWGLVPGDKAADDEEAGLPLKAVLAGGAAAKAGLKAGDRLLTLDGRWTDSLAECFLAASYVKPGRAVVVTVRRGDRELKFTVTPRTGL